MQKREERIARVTSSNGERRWKLMCRGGAGLTKGHRALLSKE